MAFNKFNMEIVGEFDYGPANSITAISLRRNSELWLLDTVNNRVGYLRVNGNAKCDNNNSEENKTFVRRPYSSYMHCSNKSTDNIGTTSSLGPAINHDPGYMNREIPYEYAQNMTVPCLDSSNRSNFNLDAILMAGHTCHRCLPEPCMNGGNCVGIQERGFVCKCPVGYTGDLCQMQTSQTNNEDMSYETGCSLVGKHYRGEGCCKTSSSNACKEMKSAYQQLQCCLD